MKMRDAKRICGIVCATIVLGVLAACGGGGGGGGGSAQPPVDKSKYTGATNRASISTANAVAFTSDAFAASSIGSSANVVGVMVENDNSPSGRTTTLPEVAALVRSSVAQAVTKKAAAASLTAVAASSTVYGTAGGSAAVSMDLNETTGNFSGSMTFNKYQNDTSGPTISGTVTMTGIYSQSTGRYDSITMACSPLSATTAKGTATIYGTFAFTTNATGEILNMSCTVSVNSSDNYWVKDWTYTYSSGTTLTITGVYYHPTYGYVEITTPTPLKVTSIAGTPTAGVFQAAGAHCSKAKLTFSATGSTVTATGDGQDWQLCD